MALTDNTLDYLAHRLVGRVEELTDLHPGTLVEAGNLQDRAIALLEDICALKADWDDFRDFLENHWTQEELKNAGL